MDTVADMFKRILILAGAAIVGFAACLLSVRKAGSWSFLPNRDLDRSASYVKEVMKTVNENYVDGGAVGYDELTRLSLHGMVDSLDPHSQFLEAKDNEELEEDLTGEYGGIGVEVEVHKGAFSVITPIAGSPGDKAGILLGDQIVSIDGTPVEHDVPMDKIVDRLRGKPHTHVRVGLVRPSDGRHMDLDLVREVIKVVSIRGTRVIEGTNTGYIEIQEFNDHTGEQFDDALNQLLKKGIDSLVIDLRNNPGGPLDAAVEVAEPFFKKDDLIVYYQGRKASDRENYLSETEGEPIRIPVAVLINDLTASAAEIVAGALKDACHAAVVGERSYGKGSVQTIFKLKDGEGLRLTTAHYFTPSGALINAKGIEPQVSVVMTPDEDEKLEQQISRPDITDPSEFKERFDFAPIEDRQLDVAVDVLKAARFFSR
jgi:carboxyl-terminal processing protease